MFFSSTKIDNKVRMGKKNVLIFLKKMIKTFKSQFDTIFVCLFCRII